MNKFSVGDVVKLKKEYKEGISLQDKGWAYWYREMLKGKSGVITEINSEGDFGYVAVDYDEGYIGFHELELVSEEKGEVSANLVEFKPEWIEYDGRAGKPEHLHDNDVVEWANSLGMSNTQTAGLLNWSGNFIQPVVKYKVVEYYQEEQPTDAIPPEYVALGEELAPVQTDVVNHPNHYQGKVECIDAIESAVAGKTGLAAVCTANIVKYLWRCERKNGLEDVKKAQWYLNKLIEHMEEQDAPTN